MKKIISIIISSVLFLFFIYILGYSKDIMESVTFSVSIWKDNLFPSLFPFLILSYFFVSYGISDLLSEIVKPVVVNIFHLPPTCGYTIVLSLFSGFPSSAKFIKDELDKGNIDINDANYLLKFCHFSSPLFVVGTIGSTLLGSSKLGFLILISHYIGSFILAFIYRRKSKIYKDNRISFRNVFKKINSSVFTSDSFSDVLKGAIKNAFDVLFLLLGIISVFLIITTVLTNIIPLSEIQKGIVSGIIEMTQGIKYISLIKLPIIYKMIVMTGFICFGGFSIHAQVLSILSDYKISYMSYLAARLLHMFFSCITLILLWSGYC